MPMKSPRAVAATKATTVDLGQSQLQQPRQMNCMGCAQAWPPISINVRALSLAIALALGVGLELCGLVFLGLDMEAVV